MALFNVESTQRMQPVYEMVKFKSYMMQIDRTLQIDPRLGEMQLDMKLWVSVVIFVFVFPYVRISISILHICMQCSPMQKVVFILLNTVAFF